MKRLRLFLKAVQKEPAPPLFLYSGLKVLENPANGLSCYAYRANDKRVPLGRQPVQEGAILAIQQGAGVHCSTNSSKDNSSAKSLEAYHERYRSKWANTGMMSKA